MSVMSVKRTAMVRARKLREKFQARGEPWSQAEFRDALSPLLADLAEVSFETFCDKVAEDIDRSNLSEPEGDDGQPTLFDLAGEYRLGDGFRIAKDKARLEHIEAALALDDANLIVVQQANIRKRQELIRLRPFLGPGVTKQRAVDDYLAANP